MMTALEKGLAVIKNVVKTLPSAPGVYRMLDDRGKILYVGKAKNLKKRVVSYTKEEGHAYRILMMISRTASMEIVVTASETAAFLLENDLIKRFMPPFNVMLKDAKTFAHIMIRQDHEFAQILKARGPKKKTGKYFGPFTNAGLINETLALLQKIFLLRSCSDGNFKNRSRPCLMYQIKRCSAPCVGYVSPQEYDGLVRQALDFFDGKDDNLQKKLVARMNAASEIQDYEQAAVYRDRIRALNQIQAHAENELTGIDSADFIAMHREGENTAIQVFFIRKEKHYGTFVYFPEFHDGGVLDSFIGQLYRDYPVPREIIVYPALESPAAIAEALSVKVTLAPRGTKAGILGEALENAKSALRRRLSLNRSWENDFNCLQELLGLDTLEKIEIYDNSHIQSAFALGVAVCATRNGFSRKDYRRFNIKEKEKAGNDTAMMEEVLTRRIKRGIIGGDIPDLFIIDGGRGQLGAAVKVAEELGIEINLLAIAKGENRNAGGETLYIPGKDPIILEKNDPVLFFLERLRDEAHRFAIGSHRHKRTKETITSELNNIAGIGPKRRRMLLQHFGSVKAVKDASLSELKKVSGFNDKVAKKVYDYFKN